MATKIYLRRGTRTEILGIVPESGEPVWATDTKALYIGDDATSGGVFVGGTGAQVISLNGLFDIITISGAGLVTVTEDGQVIVVSGEDILDVDSLNGLTGAVTISGLNGITVFEDGQIIVVSGRDEFLELIDTPSSYGGQGGKFARVNVGEDALEFAPTAFVGLTDTPANFTGSSKKLVAVNAGESALEFIKRINIEETLTSDHDWAGLVCSGIAGETLAFGELVYYASDSKWKKTIATVEGQTDGHLSLVVASGVEDDSITLLLLGYIRDDSWSWVVASGLFVHTVSGEMSQVAPSNAGEFVRRVGYAHSSDAIWFNPDGTVIERS